jgi:tetratricopeptide (TPR) repeat protein
VINKLLLFFFSLLLLAGLFAPLMASHDAQFYFDRGLEILSTTDPDRQWVYRWDLNSARADFTHAIKLNPQFTAAYTNRAGIEILRGDAGAALKDYSAAIALNPQDVNNYVLRAQAEMAQRDFEPALDDFGRAIALQSDNRQAYRGRIRVREMQNDFTGAVIERVRMIEETGPVFTGSGVTVGGGSGLDPASWRERFLRQLDRALETDTNFAWGYYYRGVIKSVSDDRTGALADYRRCQSFPDGRVKDSAAIETWRVRAQNGERARADQELLAYCGDHPAGTSSGWQMHIARFLLNQASEADLYKAIDSTDTGKQQSEFWYYSGIKRLLAGDKQGASDCFQKSLSTKPRSCAVFFSARAELQALNPSPPAE